MNLKQFVSTMSVPQLVALEIALLGLAALCVFAAFRSRTPIRSGLFGTAAFGFVALIAAVVGFHYDSDSAHVVAIGPLPPTVGIRLGPADLMLLDENDSSWLRRTLRLGDDAILLTPADLERGLVWFKAGTYDLGKPYYRTGPLEAKFMDRTREVDRLERLVAKVRLAARAPARH